MQQAVYRHFPKVQATYRFTHRDGDVYFTRECYKLFLEAISRMFFGFTQFQVRNVIDRLVYRLR